MPKKTVKLFMVDLAGRRVLCRKAYQTKTMWRPYGPLGIVVGPDVDDPQELKNELLKHDMIRRDKLPESVIIMTDIESATRVLRGL